MAELGSSDDQQGDKVLVCVFCKKRAKEAKLLDCLHAACAHCVHGRVDEKHEVQCSECQHSTDVSREGVLALPCHHVARALHVWSDGKTRPSRLCDECDHEEESIAISHCNRCGLWLCAFHVDNHKRTRRTKQHELLSASEYASEKTTTASSSVWLCHLHGEVMDMLCKTCKKPVCAKCGQFGHASHEQEVLSEQLITASKERLVSFGKAAGKMRQRLREVAERENSRVQSINESAEEVSEEIGTHYKRLRKLLKEEEAALLAEVTKHQRSMALSSEKVSREAEAAEESVNLASWMAEKSQLLPSGVAVLEQETAICKRAEQLQRETDELASRAAENSTVTSWSVFASSGKFERGLSAKACAGNVLLADIQEMKATRTARGVEVMLGLKCSETLAADTEEEDVLTGIGAKLRGHSFAMTASSEVCHTPPVAAAVAGCEPHGDIAMTACDFDIGLESVNKVRVSCLLAPPPNQEVPRDSSIAASQNKRVVGLCGLCHLANQAGYHHQTTNEDASCGENPSLRDLVADQVDNEDAPCESQNPTRATSCESQNPTQATSCESENLTRATSCESENLTRATSCESENLPQATSWNQVADLDDIEGTSCGDPGP